MEIVTKAEMKLKLLIKYGFMLLLNYILVAGIMYLLFTYTDMSKVANSIDKVIANISNDKVVIWFNTRAIFNWVIFITISLITLGRKMHVAEDIMKQPLIKQVSQLHSLIIKEVAGKAELVRLKGGKFEWEQMKTYIRDEIYMKHKDKFIEIFKMTELPLIAPYTDVVSMINFMSPTLRKYIVG